MKNKTVKSIISSIAVIPMLVGLLTVPTHAADFKISSSVSSIAPNGSFTVNVKVPGAGRFTATALNATVSSSSFWCEDACSITAKASSNGVAQVTIKAEDATGWDETLITGSKSVNVSIVKPSNNTPTKPVVVAKSSDNKLNTLKLSEGVLKPTFSPDKTEYNVSLKGNDIKLKVNAIANHSKATISGAGEIELVPGKNEIKIKVTAENGNPKIYTLNVDVEEVPVANLTYKNNKYGIISLPADVIAMDGFEEIECDYAGTKIEAIRNNFKEITLIYLLNEETKESNYFIYDDFNDKIISYYKPISLSTNSDSSGYNISLVEVPEEIKEMDGFEFTTINVDEQEMMGWIYEDKSFTNYKLFYALDENGEGKLYQYEDTSKTIQPYSNSAPITNETYNSLLNSIDFNNQQLKYALIAIGVLSGLIIIVIILLTSNKRKLKQLKQELEITIEAKDELTKAFEELEKK